MLMKGGRWEISLACIPWPAVCSDAMVRTFNDETPLYFSSLQVDYNV